MGAVNRFSVVSENERTEAELLHHAPTAQPRFTLGELKKAVPPHCFKRSYIRSFYYLFRDYGMVFVLYYLAANYIPLLPHPLRYLAWPLYWVIQGTVFMAIWVLGHECGHHAFCDNIFIEDTVGFLIHSFLFTPYFSWKFSHRRHHAHTASLEHDEVHVPKIKTKIPAWFNYVNNLPGRILTLCIKLTLGWHIYLTINAASRPYDRFASHFDPQSPIFFESERPFVFLTDLGLLTWGYLLYKLAIAQGFGYVFFIYIGPLLVSNFYVVTVTYLQHTHPSLPHYDDSKWRWIMGALSTVDRDYGFLNKFLHNVTDTHVIHHLFSSLPHYNAVEATNAIKPILGEYYQYDRTPFWMALWRESRKCLFVEEDVSDEKKGIFWYGDEF